MWAPRGAPADQRLLGVPARQRQNPAVTGQAVIADVVDEAVDLLQLGAEHLGVPEVGCPLGGLRIHLEQHGEHGAPFFYSDVTRGWRCRRRPLATSMLERRSRS